MAETLFIALLTSVVPFLIPVAWRSCNGSNRASVILEKSGLQLLPVLLVLNVTMQPITDEVIALVTRRIVAELDPEEIILFGSYAWGTPHKYSDLDLCVIVPDGISDFNRIEWGVRALNALNDLMVDVDVLIKTRSDVDTFKTVPASLTRKIVESGKLLYGQGKARTDTILATESPT